jgi:hypothetical protein
MSERTVAHLPGPLIFPRLRSLKAVGHRRDRDELAYREVVTRRRCGLLPSAGELH